MHKRPETPLHHQDSWPRFTPHITLGSAPTAEAASAAIPKGQTRVPVRFKEFQTGPVYFRSVLFAVHPETPLIKLEEDVRKALGVSGPPPAYPHMSFAYIDDSEAEAREKVKKELKERGVVKDTEDGVGVWCKREDSVFLTGFEGTEIWVAKCDGPVESWTVLEKVKLDE